MYSESPGTQFFFTIRALSRLRPKCSNPLPDTDTDSLAAFRPAVADSDLQLFASIFLFQYRCLAIRVAGAPTAEGWLVAQA
jgi:hypothetical protein